MALISPQAATSTMAALIEARRRVRMNEGRGWARRALVFFSFAPGWRGGPVERAP
jgi:hypothetical protein